METASSPATLLGAFVLTCFLIELTPGPNMAYLAVLCASKGRRAGLAATAGIALGLLLVGLGAALGLAALISSSRTLYQAMRWTGVLYLLWLAFEGWREATETSPTATDGSAPDATYFTRGLITNLLNPKAVVFYVAILPTFVDPTRGVLGQTVLLSVVYVLIATAVHSMLVILADAARPLLEDPGSSRLVRRLLSVALAGIALWFAVSTAPK